MVRYSLNVPPPLELVDEFTVRKYAGVNSQEAMEFMTALANHFIRNPDPLVVPVYRFDPLDNSDQYSWPYRYSYDMMRLGVLSKEEKNIIDDVNHARWSSGIIDPVRQFRSDARFSPKVVWQDYPRLMDFLEQVIKQDSYHDLHSENVMMDNDGYFRLVDIEGFLNQPLDRPSNNWITR